MKVKDIVEKIDDAIFEVRDEYPLYGNSPDCLVDTAEDYNSCKNREVGYITIENDIEYTKNNGMTVYSVIVIYVI